MQVRSNVKKKMQRVRFKESAYFNTLVKAGEKVSDRVPIPAHQIREWESQHNASLPFVLSEASLGDGTSLSLIEGFMSDYAKYQIGQEVVLAESYLNLSRGSQHRPFWSLLCHDAGWFHPTFVRASLMPITLHITSIGISYLHDISEAECLEEGVEAVYDYVSRRLQYRVIPSSVLYPTAKDAYIALFDSLGYDCKYEDNPLVFVYAFEVVRREIDEDIQIISNQE